MEPTPGANQQIYKTYCTLTPEQALALFRESHQTTLQWIESLSAEDLVTPGRYAWMNNNTLMAYLNSVTAAHYAWALKEVKKVFNKRA